MKIMQRFGLGLLFAGLCLLFLSLGVGHYRLTNKIAKESINDSASYALMQPTLQPMTGKTYSSKFSFIHDFKQAVAKANKSLKAQGQPVIYNNYTFNITKNSTTGILAGKQKLLWFLIIFGAIVGGALLVIIPGYRHTPPAEKNNRLYFKSITAKGWIAIFLGALLIIFYIVLYWFPEYVTNWALLLDPLSRALSGGPASQWFFYGFLYTIAVIVMGVRMLLKYRKNNYQLIRTVSVIFFQLAFAFIIPEILAALNKPAVDLKNIWPLNYDFFYDYNLNKLISSGKLGWFMLIWGIALIIIAVPVITYFFGKRWYCSWVCGCGGLAETAGDPFRQHSDKSLKAWKIERWIIHAVLVFATVMTAITLINYFSNGQLLGGATNALHTVYGFLIGSIFAGVIGVGFYPFMGSRVWCRFGCPLAAYLGLVQRFKSRFRITTNGGQCISCGNCSTYCEMGIDVRWYAQRGQNIVRSSCVGCGVCASVCPRGVLKLENGPEKGRINDQPIFVGNKDINVSL